MVFKIIKKEQKMLHIESKFKLGEKVKTRYDEDVYITCISYDRDNQIHYGVYSKHFKGWMNDFELEPREEKIRLQSVNLEFNKMYKSRSGIEGILTSICINESTPDILRVCLKSKDTHRWENYHDLENR
jgi:hypothetical protein